MVTVTPVEAGALGEPEPSQPPPRTSNVPAAVAWMVGTLLSFSAMAISVRELGGVLNLFEILMVRSIGAKLAQTSIGLKSRNIRRSAKNAMATRDWHGMSMSVWRKIDLIVSRRLTGCPSRV